MVEITIRLSDRLVAHLKEEAERQNLLIEEYIQKMLGESEVDQRPLPNTTAAHVYAARTAGIRVGADDISERSREILEEEMEKHLTRWMKDNDERA